MTIYEILKEVANEGSTNKKEEILRVHSDNELLKRVCYLAESPRIKFYIKQLPEPESFGDIQLEDCLELLIPVYSREVTGGEAFERIQNILNYTSKENQEIISKIILKDLRLNCGTKIFNKVWPGLIETTPYQGAKPFSRKLVDKLLEEGSVYAQLKMDGCYSNAIIFNGSVEFVSRQGEEQFIEIPGFEKLPDGVLNGELTLEGIPNRAQANGIIRSIIDIEGKREVRGEVETEKKVKAFEKKNGISLEEAKSKITYTAWDWLTLDEYYSKKSDRPYSERMTRLENIFLISDMDLIEYKDVKLDIVPTWVFYNFKDIMDTYTAVVQKGLEGIIVKSVHAPWKDGKPNHCIKIKEEINLDLKIVGFNFGTGKNSNVYSSVNVESSDGLLKATAAGLKEAEMKFVTENSEELLGKILEIKCNGLSQDREGNYSVLSPIFIEVRTDKTVANSLDECIEIQEAARNI